MPQDFKPIQHELHFAERTKVQAGIAAFDFSGRALKHSDVIALNYGLPDGELFQIPELHEATATALAAGTKSLQYGGGTGTARLPAYVAEMRARRWNLPCDAAEVLITSGSSQAIDLAGRLFLNPEDEVWFEAPSYFGAIHVLSLHAKKRRGFPMDADGLIVDQVEDELARRAQSGEPMPKLFYVIPNYQNPTGLTMNLERRKRLAALAIRYGFYIIEDDAYGELGFDGVNLPPIKSFAPEHTLYVTTFSKTVAPGLRVGAVIASREIIRGMQRVKSEGGTSPFVQELLANMLERVDFDAHLAHLQETYRLRRDAMIETLASVMPSGCEWTTPLGGFFVWVTLPKTVDVHNVWERAIEEQVSFVGGPPFYVSDDGKNQMRLSFSYFQPDLVREGIVRLGRAVERSIAGEVATATAPSV